MRVHGPAIGTFLSPHQLAVGVSAGVEIAAVIADLGYGASSGTSPDQDISTMSIDIRKAFNTIPRKSIYDALETALPSLIPYFTWFYGGGVELRSTTGEALGEATTGCIQGDPLSSLFFSLALQPFLLALQARMQDLEAASGSSHRGIVVAIADDITVLARTSILFSLATPTAQALTEAHLIPNLTKSFITGPNVFSTPNQPAGWTLKCDGAKTLGRPIGTTDFQNRWLADLVESRLAPRRALARLDPRSAAMVLRYSCNHRFDYIRKVVSPSLDRAPFQRSDDNIDASLRDIFRIQENNPISAIRSLPLDLGGMGMPTLLGTDHDRHYLVSQHRTQAFLSTYYPDQLGVHSSRFPTNSADGLGPRTTDIASGDTPFYIAAKKAPSSTGCCRSSSRATAGPPTQLSSSAPRLRARVAGYPSPPCPARAPASPSPRKLTSKLSDSACSSLSSPLRSTRPHARATITPTSA